jgi:Uma2 family endonuclease
MTMVQSVLMEDALEPERSSTKLTYADFLLFPDDGLRHEIIDGEHYVTPSPVTRHQRIAGNLHYLLRRHLETHPVGEVFMAPFDVLLSDVDIVVPDLVYISHERAHLITSKNLQGAADLVIEIVSPSTRRRDERLKRELYERVGVEEYWVVDPERDAINVHRRAGGEFLQPTEYARGQVLSTALLPGLTLAVDRILGDRHGLPGAA